MDADLKDRFDRALDGGPAHRPLEARLRAGRRAARRRTAGVAVAATTCLALAPLLGVTVLDRPDDSTTGTAVAPAAIPTDPPTDPPTDGPKDQAAWGDTWARLAPDGTVTVRPGATVVQQMDGVIPGRTSAALELRAGGARTFVLLWASADGIVTDVTEDASGELLDFVTGSWRPEWDLPIAIGDGGDYASLPLVAYRDGRLYTLDGVRRVRVVADPVDGYCPGWPSHAVELTYRDATYFALLSEGNCGGSFGSRTAATPTLDDFVAQARGQVG
jgi:hypothetical protein